MISEISNAILMKFMLNLTFCQFRGIFGDGLGMFALNLLYRKIKYLRADIEPNQKSWYSALSCTKPRNLQQGVASNTNESPIYLLFHKGTIFSQGYSFMFI